MKTDANESIREFMFGMIIGTTIILFMLIGALFYSILALIGGL